MTLAVAAAAFTVSALLLAVTILLSAAEAVVGVLSEGRVWRLEAAEKAGASELAALAARSGRLLSCRALATGVGYAAGAVSVGWYGMEVHGIPGHISALIGVGIAAVVFFVVGEAMPRAFALHSPERVGLAVARPARRVTAVLFPVTRLLALPWTWAVSMVDGKKNLEVPWTTFQDYEDALADEEAPDAASRDSLVDSIERFSERIVREVMVPRTDMACVEDTLTVAEALNLIRRTGFSRIPVFHENLDDIRGVLYARDLLLALGDGIDAESKVSRLIRPAYFVPETKPVRELLVQMRRTAHMAIVADEYGGTAGLVTIEDLLEEIVGDIFDEYDRQVPMVVELGGGRYRVDGRLSIDELNELFETDLVRETDSVGGLFIEEAGHIPVAGESVVVEGLRLVVEEVEGNRIHQLIVEATGPQPGKEGRDVRGDAI
ncbi:MAG: hypothetical protein Kow0056_03830 [Coriobacteriia bacterium]